MENVLPVAKSRFSRNETPPAALPSGNLLSDLVRDLRFGLRGMMKAPTFSLFAVLTLALGIGAGTTVFTVVNTLLLHALPAHDPSALVCLYTTDVKNGKQSGIFNGAHLSWRQIADAFFDENLLGIPEPLMTTWPRAGLSETYGASRRSRAHVLR